MDKMIAKSQAGITVLRLRPTPNSLRLPSKLYKNAGLKTNIKLYKKIYINI